MVEFLPEYIVDDFVKPTEYHYTFKAFFGLINIPIHWNKIVYGVPDFDIQDVTL